MPVDSRVYQRSSSGGSWTYSLLYSFSGSSGIWGTLVRDAGGNLYGATCGDGAHGQGSVFKLTPSGEGWTESDLYDFTGGSDGACPIGGVGRDAAGNRSFQGFTERNKISGAVLMMSLSEN